MSQSKTTLGEQLEAKQKTLAEQLQDANVKAIISKIENKLKLLLTGKTTTPMFEITILLKELGISPDDVRSTDGHTKKEPLYEKLTQWAKSEKLTLTVHWVHPDCSYCESCGSGCKPVSLHLSWKNVKS